MRKSIAAEVRAELARQSKSHRDLGEILDLPQSSVSLRLSGDRSFRAEELAIMAAGLEVPVAKFFPPTIVSSDLAGAA